MQTGTACQTIVPLFRDPDATSERVDEMLYGMAAEVGLRSADGEWVQIRTRYGYSGWVKADCLLVPDMLDDTWETKARVLISHAFADLLSDPREDAPLLQTLTRGCLLRDPEDRIGRWSLVRLVGGEAAWVPTSALLTPENRPVPGSEAWRERVVNSALGYLGTQYRWGGKSPSGIDCSGLSFMAYYLNGVTLPRDADVQQEFLAPIARDKAKKGDLLFSPGHVMICLGEGKYVHATGREGYVIVNSLDPMDSAYREDIDRNCREAGTLRI